MEYPHWMMVVGAVLMVLGFIGLGFSRNRNLEPTEDNLQKEIGVSHETVRKARGSIVNELTTAAPPNSSVAGKAEEEEMSARHSSAELWKPEDDDRLRALSTFIESPSEIGRLLHRSPSAVRKRASLLGITVQGL
jgi:hypothetical protein